MGATVRGFKKAAFGEFVMRVSAAGKAVAA